MYISTETRSGGSTEESVNLPLVVDNSVANVSNTSAEMKKYPKRTCRPLDSETVTKDLYKCYLSKRECGVCACSTYCCH